MDREEKINAVRSLVSNYQQGTDMSCEYTTRKFDFLAQEGLISHDISPFFNKAVKEYLYELTNMQNEGDIVLAHTIAQVKIALLKGSMNNTQKKYVNNLAKICALREWVKTCNIDDIK